LAVTALLAGCASSSDGGGGNAGPSAGVVTEAWSDLCTVTFTEPYQVMDIFDEPVFAAQPGDTFLVSDYSDGGQVRAELIYLAPAGPYDFEITAAPDMLPFMTSCDPGSMVPQYAAFKDVAVFSDVNLTTPLCNLAEGSVHPRDTTAQAGYAAAGGFGISGPATYDLFLNSFSTQCNGATHGFISVAETQLFGVTTWLIPVTSVMGPQ
jgi:hypothetical protein